ncbi:hypothetical protein HZA76_02995 [Candidatus Roizmanbacteria bacterium]|nr:hypothetical protein [Candidatus Roizmanbacteria bacterium]
MDDFFSVVSKGVIFVPIIVVISALLIKFNQNVPPPRKNVSVSPTAAATPVQAKSKKINIDLKGPLVCRYKSDNQEYNLFVKNKKVDLEVKSNSKTIKYDLSSYLPFMEGMLNKDITTLESMANQYLGRKIDLEAILKTCKKEDFK